MLLFLGVFSGCVTTSDPYSITVKADRLHAPSTAVMKYALVYSGPRTEHLVDPLHEYVEAALAQRGYEAVPTADAMVLIYVDAMSERLTTGTREMTPMEAGVPGNPDSIRFKNAAAMLDGGRYPELLNDHNPNARGEIFLGPDGSIIATGDLRRMEDPPPPPHKKVFRKITGLVLSAVAAPLPQDPADATILWRVEVLSEQDLNLPAPDMRRLVEVATEYVERNTGGRPRRVRSASW